MLASIGTADLSEMCESASRVADLVDQGDAAGIHLEGPFISKRHRGAHPEQHVLSPDRSALEVLLDAGRGHVRVVTLAPEQPGMQQLEEILAERGIRIAVGHTAAGYEDAREALARRGYSLLTHTFNGMPPVHHRHPGPALAGLDDPRAVLELVADGIHVHPAMARLLFAVAGGRVALVTDAMRAAGQGDGKYPHGDTEVVVRDGQARLIDGTSIAGSTLTMDRAVANTIAAGVPLLDAVKAATEVPARVLGLGDVGAIAVGNQADLVILDEELQPQVVIRRGKVEFG